mmetsp:Transcript_19834/g.24458  ORF Transcript_19834/g.24458 Transcript_19834/m.24458 type:complete len:532 (+) Transcript_19834:80-1675(+)|eukprot:CAMPEP_0172502684 /NCGR_PEP_ID=MMETSP1066-20121228/161863_1 /TAXON_ID=671091 /ORGANISM="Coscinodiscus wailesii, Strain CCMP2513" /LENGTH=531 /DNA_ID=CAMNT_0013278021 /DNA_START=67 /DNA_END=1662 /DNA_ORIENTATION=-
MAPPQVIVTGTGLSREPQCDILPSKSSGGVTTSANIRVVPAIRHKFHPSILRANDVRGIVGKTLFSQDAYILGKCIGTNIRERFRYDDGANSTLDSKSNNNTRQYRVCVGRDGRLSSPSLESALIDGLVSAGIHVLQVGIGPTPMIYFAEQLLSADAAVMVTGSHNPPPYNGFKISLRGKALFDDDIRELGRIAESGCFAQGFVGLRHCVHHVEEEYVNYLIKDYRDHYINDNSRKLKVAWDCGNGAAGDICTKLRSQLPGEHILLNNTIDGSFPAHHPDPTVVKNLTQLISTVRSNNCDLGVAFDGDADRIGVVDGTGTVLWADQLLILYAEEILEGHGSGASEKACVIADVKASQSLFDTVERLGGRPVMCRTGHSLIKSQMREHNAPLAGEMSGHIFFADRFMGFDDAIYAALRLMGRLSVLNMTLAEWRKRITTPINTPEMRLACPEERKWEVVDEVGERIRERTAVKCIEIDGLRVIHEDGWWLLRASNTESVLVVRVEANNEHSFQRLKADVAHQLQLSGFNLCF